MFFFKLFLFSFLDWVISIERHIKILGSTPYTLWIIGSSHFSFFFFFNSWRAMLDAPIVLAAHAAVILFPWRLAMREKYKKWDFPLILNWLLSSVLWPESQGTALDLFQSTYRIMSSLLEICVPLTHPTSQAPFPGPLTKKTNFKIFGCLLPVQLHD